MVSEVDPITARSMQRRCSSIRESEPPDAICDYKETKVRVERVCVKENAEHNSKSASKILIKTAMENGRCIKASTREDFHLTYEGVVIIRQKEIKRIKPRLSSILSTSTEFHLPISNCDSST